MEKKYLDIFASINTRRNIQSNTQEKFFIHKQSVSYAFSAYISM